MFAAGSVDSTFDVPLEGWGASVDALSNKIAERCSHFQAPLLPRRWYPLKLRPQIEDHIHVEPIVEPGEQLCHSRIRQILSTEDRNMISLAVGHRCNLFAESLRKFFRSLPSLLNRPYRCADEIGSRLRKLQILIKNKNTILL